MNWHDYFTYDAATGNLIWKERPLEHFKTKGTWKSWNTQFSGKLAGLLSKTKGYAYVSVNTVRYSAHRVIWEMCHGSISEGMVIDHINRIRHDNRIENLRECLGHQNQWNALSSKNSKSGIKGVYYYKRYGTWAAHINANGVTYYLGRYPTKGEAAVVHAKASLRYHGKFSPYYKPQLSC